MNEILLDIPGTLLGLSGLFSLVHENWSKKGIRGLTWGFIGFVGYSAIVAIAVADQEGHRYRVLKRVLLRGPEGAFTIFIILAVFFADWILAILADNLAGTPSSDNSAFYWTYFIAKRLPMGNF